MALKIKRINRSMLDELGDGWEVLTAAEVTEAGFTLADDEVIVQEKAAPPEPPAGEAPDVTELRSNLHKVNTESAARRIALREQKDKIAALEQENATLKANETKAKTEKAKTDATQLFNQIVQEKKVAFASEVAGEDARTEIFGAIDWTKGVTKEILEPLVTAHLEKKPYIIKAPALGSTDAGKQGTPGDAIEIDLDEVASAFGLPPLAKEKEKGVS